MFAGADVKLINFSLPVPTTEKVPGVPEFVAPEQVDGKPVDQRSNLYSLGALYYYVLTGQTVHGGSPEEVHRAHTNGSIKTPSSLIAVPGPVEAVIMRALDRSPTKRFLTVRQFVDEVTRVARGEEVKTTQPLGKAGGKPKAELVQTLLGVRSGGGGGAVQVPAAPILPAAAASTPAAVTAPGPGPSPMTPPVKPSPLVVTTVAGVPTAVAPKMLSNPGIAPPPAAATAPSPSSTVVGTAAAPTPVTDAKSAPQAVPPPERSPWAPPSTVPPANADVAAAPAPAPAPTPISQAPTAATPAVEAPAAPVAPVVAAPVLKAPTVAQPKDTAAVSGKNPAPSGKKKAPGEGESKGKFRETMWFKKGELDAEAAQQAAAERARTGKDSGSTDKADSLPMDERYKDDGSITRSDKEKYSLRTGGTQMMGAMKEDGRTKSGSRSGHISEDELISEMKGGRTKILLMIAAGAIVLAVILIVALS
jgi:hypothetical protein